jgi:tetratricopeptide (TPR) repeat protein
VLDNVVLGLVDDLKPFGKKSITYAIEDSINTNVNDGVTYYKELKENKPEVYDFSDENSLNSLGYRVLRSGDTQGAIKIFTLNTEEFPESSNPFDSLGEAYLEEGNYQMALKNYKKALSLDPNATNAKEMITKIEALVNAS